MTENRKRTVKQVSFAANEYEGDLLEYATKPEHGPFSVYIKRLISKDRELRNREEVVVTNNVPRTPQQPSKPSPSQKDRDDATAFL